MALEQAGPERVVSSDSEELILVDEADREIGTLSKGECHDGEGILHRAFSVFLFDAQGRLLVQQRASEKRLWPGSWANSCCSHPRAGEDMDEATVRRTREELGVAAELEFVYKFQYQARYRDMGAEHELCWVYIGRTHENEVRPNPTEIDGWRFLTPEDVDSLVADEAADVAPWFRMEWRELRRVHWRRVEQLLNG
ncbi:isopentenyl-diphosphate Delta-isomerase [Wenzhouxiangella sp. EGI_FJ10305]|uniref:isopentenyl-diphosphate Delta-isomerase n=1 Tax=Wenzhouxiangella sp. EGI_FJ10305 TaxID=3243768 RepID=UPI0035DCFF58